MKTIFSILSLLALLLTSCSGTTSDLPEHGMLIIGTGDVSDVIGVGDPSHDPVGDCGSVEIQSVDIPKTGPTPTYFDTASYRMVIECQTIYFISDSDPTHPSSFPVGAGQYVWRKTSNWAIRPR